MSKYDAIIIGGGFYGCYLATQLSRRLSRVVVLEREEAILSRASYRNQARLHNGYHYPRSFGTASSSHLNFSVFAKEFPDCVAKDFTAVYGIARRRSKVTSRHFERFFKKVGSPIRPARSSICKLFSPRLISEVYDVDEFAFDAHILRDCLIDRLKESSVEVLTNSTVKEVVGLENNSSDSQRYSLVTLEDGRELEGRWILNCTYSGLHCVKGMRHSNSPDLQHIVAEIALFQPPEQLQDLAITIMDGPFFSFMPFPSRNLHSLSHVRYTHHFRWTDSKDMSGVSPYCMIDDGEIESKARYMVDDAARYVPVIREATHIESLFETKTLLPQSELHASRPIFVERDPKRPQLISILGGKIDNIFDVVAHLDEEIGIN